jgi:XTP/dITP diphosphohydrolase
MGFEAHGQNGFGYDPLFVPVGFEQTFAELGEGVKNNLSHRARALEKLKRFLTNKNG